MDVFYYIRAFIEDRSDRPGGDEHDEENQQSPEQREACTLSYSFFYPLVFVRAQILSDKGYQDRCEGVYGCQGKHLDPGAHTEGGNSRAAVHRCKPGYHPHRNGVYQI